MRTNFLMEWFQYHPTVFWWLGAVSLLMFIGTIIAIPLVIIYLPVRYFNPAERPRRLSQRPFSTLHWLLLILKNIIGVLLIVAGFVMLLLPGQGLVTLLIGLSLVNLPGKRNLIRRILQQPQVFGFINRVRTAARRPPVPPPN